MSQIIRRFCTNSSAVSAEISIRQRLLTIFRGRKFAANSRRLCGVLPFNNTSLRHQVQSGSLATARPISMPRTELRMVQKSGRRGASQFLANSTTAGPKFWSLWRNSARNSQWRPRRAQVWNLKTLYGFLFRQRALCIWRGHFYDDAGERKNLPRGLPSNFARLLLLWLMD